jgi:hypothetical protein
MGPRRLRPAFATMRARGAMPALAASRGARRALFPRRRRPTCTISPPVAGWGSEGDGGAHHVGERARDARREGRSSGREAMTRRRQDEPCAYLRGCVVGEARIERATFCL